MGLLLPTFEFTSVYLFVDIGYFGNIPESIRKLLPEANLEFDYAISYTSNVRGFIGEIGLSLQSAMMYDACIQEYLEKYFAESSESASARVKVNDRIYPTNTKITGQEQSKLNKQRSYFRFDTRIEGQCYEDQLFSDFFQLLVIRNYSKAPLDSQQLQRMRNRLDQHLLSTFQQVKSKKPAKKNACALS